METSDKLRELRKIACLSQTELAKKINVTTQAVSKWECGKSYPDLFNLITLSNMYDVSLDELIKSDIKLQEKLTDTFNFKRMFIILLIALLSTLLLIYIGSSIISLVSNKTITTINWLFAGITYLFITIYFFVILKGRKIAFTKK